MRVRERLLISVVDQNGSIKSDNVKATYDGTKWTTEKTVNYSPTYQYYAYYPYTTSGLANLGSSSSKGSIVTSGTQAANGARTANATRAVPANTSASDFFASGISAFTPATNQSTATNFNASDLQVGKATISRTLANDIDFVLTHAMGLAKMTINKSVSKTVPTSITYNGLTGAETGRVSTTTTVTISSSFSGSIPYTTSTSNIYIAIVKPMVNTKFTTTASGTGVSWEAVFSVAGNNMGAFTTPAEMITDRPARTVTWNYAYSGASTTFATVCPGMYSFDLYGAAGGYDTPNNSSALGGNGGRIYARKFLYDNMSCTLFIGGKGANQAVHGVGGGYNGGGNTGGSGGADSGGGGGGTDVRYSGTAITDRILVAGGGGGGSGSWKGLDGGAADSGNNGTLFYGTYTASVDGGGGGGGYYGGTSGQDSRIYAHGGSNYVASDWTTLYNGTSSNQSNGSITVILIP